MKEVVVLSIGFNPTRSTPPCYSTTHAYNVHKIIHTRGCDWPVVRPSEIMCACWWRKL